MLLRTVFILCVMTCIRVVASSAPIYLDHINSVVAYKRAVEDLRDTETNQESTGLETDVGDIVDTLKHAFEKEPSGLPDRGGYFVTLQKRMR